MNQGMLDVACFTFSVGACAGSFVGYWVRGIKERHARAQTDRAWVASKQTPRRYDAVTGQVLDRREVAAVSQARAARISQDQRAEDVLARNNQVIPILRSKNPTPQTVADTFPDGLDARADVLAALKDSGFNNAKARAAVDACSPGDRVNIETWIRAALAYAINTRSRP